MKTLDVRGYSCPEPQLLTENAMKKGEFPLTILVSEPHQAGNVGRVIKRYGKEWTTEEKDGYFRLTVK